MVPNHKYKGDCESVFVKIDICTLIPKMAKRDVFPMKPKRQSFIPMRKMHLGCPIMKRKRLLCRSMSIPIER